MVFRLRGVFVVIILYRGGGEWVGGLVVLLRVFMRGVEVVGLRKEFGDV